MAHISLFFYFTLSRAFTLTGRVGGEDMTTVNDKLSPYYSSASPFYLFFFFTLFLLLLCSSSIIRWRRRWRHWKRNLPADRLPTLHPPIFSQNDIALTSTTRHSQTSFLFTSSSCSSPLTLTRGATTTNYILLNTTVKTYTHTPTSNCNREKRKSWKGILWIKD